MTAEFAPEGSSRTGNRGASPNYFRVLATFARNSLIRDMTFRTNFLIESVSSMAWTMMNLGFYVLVFNHTRTIGRDSGWGENEFFVFLATTWIINSIVQAFFMPNAEEFSELIRTGNLDFALLKPIDTQFLISFNRIEWSALANFLLGGVLLCYAMWKLMAAPEQPLEFSFVSLLLYGFYVLCGVSILYSVMISLAATSIWLGRNQSLYNFWFYITNFCRYPMEIYQQGFWGWSLWGVFTFVVPILVVVNVPARILAQPLRPATDSKMWWLMLIAGVGGFAAIFASRFVFKLALNSYRSASS